MKPAQSQISKKIEKGIAAARDEEYLVALTLLSEAYSSEQGVVTKGKPPEGLSFYGLCVALVQKKFKPAIELCKHALNEQFYNPDHYVNLARVYEAAGNRKKALAALEDGLKILPEDSRLLDLRRQFGHRARPAVPFLTRENPVNRALGRARHVNKKR